MTADRERIKSIVDELVGQEGLLGAALVSRDGIPVHSKFTRQFDRIAFSILVEGAMVATLMGSAEEAMAELEGGPMRCVTIESAKLRLSVIGAGNDLLLVGISEPALETDELVHRMTKTAAALEGTT